MPGNRISIDTRQSAIIHRKSWLGRRVDQVKQILFAPEFENGDSIFKFSQDELSSEEEISALKKKLSDGFSSSETKVIVTLERLQKGPLQVLVVGCGVGRECFAMEVRGHKVTGIDFSESMVENSLNIRSSRVSKVQFLQSKLEDIPPVYDIIWLTERTIQHLPGSENRIKYLKLCKEKVLPTGRIVFSPEIRSFFGKPSLTWSSRLLKYRWKSLNLWSPGDVGEPRRIENPHSNQLLYYHYYLNKQDILLEMATAGVAVDNEVEDYWIIKP